LNETPEKSGFLLYLKSIAVVKMLAFVSSTENQMSHIAEYKSILAGKSVKVRR
jgi:hypothetical protein